MEIIFEPKVDCIYIYLLNKLKQFHGIPFGHFKLFSVKFYSFSNYLTINPFAEALFHFLVPSLIFKNVNHNDTKSSSHSGSDLKVSWVHQNFETSSSVSLSAKWFHEASFWVIRFWLRPEQLTLTWTVHDGSVDL